MTKPTMKVSDDCLRKMFDEIDLLRIIETRVRLDRRPRTVEMRVAMDNLDSFRSGRPAPIGPRPPTGPTVF